MEERAQRLGARLEIRSAEGTGTTVHLEAAHT
jgi:nitrate/nitrite-specific signal transduction histidine kinase